MDVRNRARAIMVLCMAGCAGIVTVSCGSVPGGRLPDAGGQVPPDAAGDAPIQDAPTPDLAPPDARPGDGGDAPTDRPSAAADAAADRPGSTDAPADSACQPEQCNGRDDDCDGVIDDGCPLDLRPLATRTVAMTSPVYGSTTEVLNTTFADTCPDGQVIVGLTGNAGSALDAIGVNCGTLTIREDRSTTPYAYSVAVGAGMQYAPLGGMGGGQNVIDNALLCGLDEVVTAIQVSREPTGGACATNGCPAGTTSAVGCPALYGLSVSCAKLAIRGTTGAFTLGLAATPTTSAHVGGTGRTGVPATVDTFSCPPAGVLRSATGSYGPWASNCAITVVNGLQLTCANPVIPVR
jgi:hypothetical protein